MQMDVRLETDPNIVNLFYAQSLSVVDFLISKFGNGRFADLCRSLKNGKSFEEALALAYTNIIENLDELQERWIKHITTP